MSSRMLPPGRVAQRLVSYGLWLILACLASLIQTSSALANGGVIQLAQEPAGPYELTVTTSPSPIRVGSVDVSVMVERAGSSELIQNATVLVTAEPIGHPGAGGTFEATREMATNKLFYAAEVRLPTEGHWRIGIHVNGPLGEGAASFDVEATQSSLLDNPFFLLLLGLIPISIILWAVSRRRNRARRHVLATGDQDN